MTVGVPPGGLRLAIGKDGRLDSSITIHVRFDVCPTWVELSLSHLATAANARAAREVAWRGCDESAKAASLEKEFEASMQAIMSAAIALDAFYAILQQHVALPANLVMAWRSKRTARYLQVSELVRRAFRLKPKGAAVLRKNLKEIYRVRDLAVHPSGKIQAPIHHPELDVGVEWRFAYFRASNAELIVNAATWILWELCHWGKSPEPKVMEYITNLKTRLLALLWRGFLWRGVGADLERGHG